MINKILIANRGEIAVRIIRACKEMGIISVAAYSESDKTSLHVQLADESYFLEGTTAAETYLNKEKIIKIALENKVDAIHPGYGFLSENSEFIKLVEVNNLIFIGPSSKSVEMMGSKTAARKLMQKNGVPVVPGTIEPIKSNEDGLILSEEIGFPVLLKASAGGGGKGMKKVFNKEEFVSAFESAQREALKSFGDDSVYIEKLIENPKHIEVQIIADKFGNYRHLFERECSIQRRHQKIIEEAPSPSINEETRKRITETALQAAKACDYYNAGTIELLLDNNNNYYFLEMNTRLQVEHPVTELITNIDLVKEQINIANGNKISFKQEEIKINGHAIECRIYAEDTENNFAPSTGIINYYKTPSGKDVRLDSGIEKGSNVSIYYDPMLSKLSVKSENRIDAINKMIQALNEYEILGCINNINYLKTILMHKKFINNDFSINFIDNNADELKLKIPEDIEIAATIFSAFIKKHSVKKKFVNSQNNFTKNKWNDLIYE